MNYSSVFYNIKYNNTNTSGSNTFPSSTTTVLNDLYFGIHDFDWLRKMYNCWKMKSQKMKKAIKLSALVIFVIVFVAVLRKNRLAFLDFYFETSFYKEKYTVVEHRHISGRDPSDVYIIKLDDMSRTETLDISNFDDGYTHQARELVLIIDDSVTQNTDLKTKVYSNKRLGHKLVIVYNLETRYFTIYFITF